MQQQVDKGNTVTPTLFETLPLPLRSISTQPLFVMRLQVRPIEVVGQTPGVFRRIGIVPGGFFEGDRLQGEILNGGSDWQAVRADGSTSLDVRLLLRTDDGALITMSYRGIRSGPADIIAKIEKGEVVDPKSYYFRINPIFECSSDKYAWLNCILAIGTGHREAGGPVYSVFEVL
jgi:hypothetical protein